MSLTPSFPVVLDNTIRAAFVGCPRRAFNEFFLQRAPLAGPSVDLVAGASYAKGLERARKAYFGEGLPLDTSINCGAIELLKSWPESHLEVGNHPKSIERVLGAYGYYHSVWPMDQDPFTPLKTQNGAAVEFSFVLPLPINHPENGEPLLYAGRFDALVQHRGGSCYILDDKTTRQLGASWAQKWTLRSQFSGYCWAAREFGVDVVGAVIRGVSILKTSFGHAEAITARNHYQIDLWYQQLLRDVRRMIECWDSKEWDYNLADTCAAYGGCPYLEACVSPRPDLHLESMEHREWNPAGPILDE